ncbi:neuropeptides capa receptor-like [Ptychodera flava]|uniref:neuropeptides capa receptor-like n=1 Tax=Ptychodera flava TaxID=63121 RepID=UPI003969F299
MATTNNTTTTSVIECFMNEVTVVTVTELIGIVGVISNLSFLFVTARVKALQNATNYLLISLSVSDLVYLLFHITLRSSWIPADDENWQKVRCVKGTLTTGVYTTSIMTILTIGIERYLGICKPVFYKTRGLGQKTRIIPLIVVLWVLGMIYGFVYTLHCYFDYSSYNEVAVWWATSVIMTLLYFSSMAVVSVLYALIIRRLHVSSGRLEHAKKIQRDRIQVVRLCVVTAIVFFVCLFPRTLYFLAYFHFLATDDEEFVDLLWCWNDIFIIILMFNSAVNPMIYNITCSRYRRAFAQGFGCRPMEVDRSRGVSFTSTRNRKLSEISRSTCVTNTVISNGNDPFAKPYNNSLNDNTFQVNIEDADEHFV